MAQFTASSHTGSWQFVVSLSGAIVLSFFAAFSADTSQALYILGAVLCLLTGLRGATLRPRVEALEQSFAEQTQTNRAEHEELSELVRGISSRTGLLESDVQHLRQAIQSLRHEGGTSQREFRPQWGPALAFLFSAIVLSVSLIVLVAWPKGQLVMNPTAVSQDTVQSRSQLPHTPVAEPFSEPKAQMTDPHASESHALWKVEGMERFVSAQRGEEFGQ